MTERPTTILSTRATLSLALGVALLASSVPARAGDNDDVPIDTKIFRGIMSSLGLKRDGDSGIEYGDRAPLVIPPSRTLPPPENSDAAVARNPAWPKDPDIKRRKEYEKQENKGVTSAEIDTWSRPLSPAEMTPGGSPNTPGPRIKTSVPAGAEGQRLTPTELGYRGGLFDIFGKRQEGTASFTGEPARTSLTEPPSGYQTPSAAQPYGEAKADSAPKAGNATDQRIEAATK